MDQCAKCQYSGFCDIVGITAFYNTSKLESVDLPDNLKTMGWGAFQHSGLKSLDLPDSMVSVGAHALATGSLSELTVSDTTKFSEEAFWDRGYAYPRHLQVFCKGQVEVCENNLQNAYQGLKREVCIDLAKLNWGNEKSGLYAAAVGQINNQGIDTALRDIEENTEGGEVEIEEDGVKKTIIKPSYTLATVGKPNNSLNTVPFEELKAASGCSCGTRRACSFALRYYTYTPPPNKKHV